MRPIFIVVCFGICFGLKPTFRILAPQFICGQPKADDLPISAPGATTIRLQTASGQQFNFNWTVRFQILNSPRDQRFNLLVWRVVRELEKTLNRMSPEISETNMVVINNTMLMEGVNYVFNITGINKVGEIGDPRTFTIEFKDAEPKFDIAGKGSDDQFSVIMVGSDTTHADNVYFVEAEVTPCNPTNDYYFEWMVVDLKSKIQLDIEPQIGKKLTIFPNTLIGGYEYDVTCKIMKYSDKHVITQNGLYLSVIERGLSIETSVEKLTVAAGTSFNVTSNLRNPDNYPGDVSYQWKCSLISNDGKDCNLQLTDTSILNFVDGLVNEGMYQFEIIGILGEKSASKYVIIIVQNAQLPVISIDMPIYAISGQQVQIDATVSELMSSCKLYWKCLRETGYEYVDEDSLPALKKLTSINSHQETFLSEIVDYGNETMIRSYPLIIQAAGDNWGGLKADVKYKFRLLAECSCPISMTCEGASNTTAFSDVIIETNGAPAPRPIKVAPFSGRALLDVFKFSTTTAVDLARDYPLTYIFGYKNGNREILISEYVENLSIETALPYSENPLVAVLRVCDARKACSYIEGDPVTTTPPDLTLLNFNFNLNKFEMQLKRKEYHDAFYGATIIIETLQAMKEESLKQSENIFVNGVKELIESDIKSQSNDLNSQFDKISAMKYVEVCMQFIERFSFFESLRQDVLKLKESRSV